MALKIGEVQRVKWYVLEGHPGVYSVHTALFEGDAPVTFLSEQKVLPSISFRSVDQGPQPYLIRNAYDDEAETFLNDRGYVIVKEYEV